MSGGLDNPAFKYERSSPPDGTTNGDVDNKAFQTDVPQTKSSLPPKHMKAEDIPYDYRCGYFSCRPDSLQCCNSPKAILFWLSFFALVQGFVVNGINNVNTSSVERRFSLSSSQVGWISSIYDISAGILVIPITYYGTHGHQPRMLSITALVMAVGSFIMALPHFITGKYELGENVADKCYPFSNMTDCTEESSNLPNYLYVLMLGMFLKGIGGTTLYTIGFVYLDSNVKTKNFPLYQGIMLAFSTLGPAVGYLGGGTLLDYFVDFDTVDSVSIDSEDARWVGAWWVGFLCSGSLFIIVFIGMFPFPKETPAGRRARAQLVSEAHQDGSEEKCAAEGFMTTWRDIPLAVKLLVTNPVLVFVTLGTTSEGIIIAGFATFFAKIVQNQFHQGVSWAALLAGFVTVPGAAGGNLAAGIFIKCLDLKVKGMLRLASITCFMVAVLSLVALVRCQSAPVAGLTVPYTGQSKEDIIVANLSAPCNAACDCSTFSYEPICGIDDVQYFSPCHAGCTDSFRVDGEKVYGNCSCIDSSLMNMTSGVMAKSGVCDVACNQLSLFLPFFFLVIFFTIGNYVPAANITLRIIPHKQRAFGMGIQSVVSRLLGTFLGPLLFGFVFDDACVLWQERCSQQGSCWIYDTKRFSVNLLTLSVVIKVFSGAVFAIALCLYKPPEVEKLVYSEHNQRTTDSNGKSPDLTSYDNPVVTETHM